MSKNNGNKILPAKLESPVEEEEESEIPEQITEEEHLPETVESEPSKHGPRNDTIIETEADQSEDAEIGQIEDTDQNEEHADPELLVADEVVEEKPVVKEQPQPEKDSEIIVPDQIVETDGQIVLQVQAIDEDHITGNETVDHEQAEEQVFQDQELTDAEVIEQHEEDALEVGQVEHDQYDDSAEMVEEEDLNVDGELAIDGDEEGEMVIHVEGGEDGEVEYDEEEGQEIVHHQVEFVPEDQDEEDDDEDDDDNETSEIILCVDTSVSNNDEYEVIQQPKIYIQKSKEMKPVIMKAGPTSSKPVVVPSGPKMIKITYGGGFSGEVLPKCDESGDPADDSEVVEQETRVIHLTTTSAGGQRFTVTPASLGHKSPIKFIKTSNSTTSTPAKIITMSSAAKRPREEVLTLETYEPEAEYEVDSTGVVVVRKSSQMKHHSTGRNYSGSSNAPKTIACYYCSFRALTVEEMEIHLNEEHMNEGEDGHRKRIRKRSHRQKDGDSSAEQTSDYDDSERSMLDETRESRNPNFECWRCNNRSFAGSGSLRRHINAVHLRLGNHPCQYCGKLFSAKHNLKVHAATVHLRQRNYVCVFCNRTYTENRSLKRHIESSHAGQKYEGMDYVYPYREKGRPRSKPDHNLKYLNSSEIVYETEEQMESYELDEEQMHSVEDSHHMEDEGHHEEVITEGDESQNEEVVVEERTLANKISVEPPTTTASNFPIYVAPEDEKSKTQVVIYHDDSISASEEVVVCDVEAIQHVEVEAEHEVETHEPEADEEHVDVEEEEESEMGVVSEEVVVTNNVDLAVEENEGMETFEIKLEVNGNYDSYYSLEPADCKSELVIYETKGSGEEMMMSSSEVVVANEEEVEHEQVTIHYINADGTPIKGNRNRTTYHVNSTYDDLGETTPGGAKRKPYQRIKCGYCGDFFCSRQLFYKHANKVHKDHLMEDWHCCPECRRYFPSVEAVKLHCSLIHANENKKTECPYCTTLFTRTCTYYRHANQSHLEIISKTWLLCDGCDLYMPESDKLRQHQVHAHPPRKQKH